MYPKIYLAIDNCFAYKRWTKPNDWAQVIAELGLRYIEASADTELDPLYMGKSYLKDWVSNVKEAENKYNVKVCNLYSGHGTYTTLGITHIDQRVREHMINDWFFPMIEIAHGLGCGLGFFAHAFEHSILQDKGLYNEYIAILIESLVRINSYAGEIGCGKLGVEQMYTPHQYPWRISDTENLIRQVSEKSDRDFYFTEDVGHHHTRFMRPDKKALTSENIRNIWLGTDHAYALADNVGISAWDKITADMDSNPHLFSTEQDGDCYAWLEKLGCYSPIIHLQQTDGRASAHLPFTEDQNSKGKITGERLLRSVKQSYDQKEQTGMPKRSNEIYLTLEMFSGTTSFMHDVLYDIKKSIDYWRRFVPKDGLRLDELVKKLDE
jgi:hypothetical protein